MEKRIMTRFLLFVIGLYYLREIPFQQSTSEFQNFFEYPVWILLNFLESYYIINRQIVQEILFSASHSIPECSIPAHPITQGDLLSL